MISPRRYLASISGLLPRARSNLAVACFVGSRPAVGRGRILGRSTVPRGGYHTAVLAHCEQGPTAIILDFKTKTQFFCVNDGAVDIQSAIPPDAKPGSLVPPTQIVWRPGCWKAPFGFDVDPNAMILTPQYSQSPPPNYYMTMNVVVLYNAAKPTIKVCLVPLFPKFAVAPACGDAEIRS